MYMYSIEDLDKIVTIGALPMIHSLCGTCITVYTYDRSGVVKLTQLLEKYDDDHEEEEEYNDK